MDLILLPQHWASILAICVMIGSLVIARVKKWMITFALIFANIMVFVITLIFYDQTVYGLSHGLVKYAGLGFRPIYLSVRYSPQVYTLFTSMFVHGGFLHIFGNMLIFLFIGIPFEQRVGWKKFLIIYLMSGVFGAITHSILNLGSASPLIGASGAIFGIMGAFAFSYPYDKVVLPIPIGMIMVFRNIRVIYAVLIFAAMETLFAVLNNPTDTIAHFAHLGGLAGGVVLSMLLIKNSFYSKTGGKHDERPYDLFDLPKPKKIDFDKLQELAVSPYLENMLTRIENETVPQVRDIWLEHFFEKTRCPRCGSKLNHFDGKTWCDNCGYSLKY